VVQQIQQAREYWGWSARKGIRVFGLSRASVQRWTQRLQAGEQPLRTPVRTHAVSEELWNAITALRHGLWRSAGAPALYKTWRHRLPRRALGALVRQSRQAWQQHWQRLCWRRIGAVWAMDPAEHRGQTWNLVSDLASRFRFAVRLHTHLPASQVAAELKALFLRYGAPLFLKRDNGSNLVSTEVNTVLEEFGVIALTSPRRYPRYNGAIENGQRELKTELKKLAGWPLLLAAWWARLRLNTRARRCLSGCSARSVFLPGHQRFQVEYTLERRKEVKDWIQNYTKTILINMRAGSRRAHEAAWRQAVETWLLEHGFLEVLQPKNVLPHSGQAWPQ
jgi:hypothetical protein